MSERLKECFDSLKQGGRKALVTYVTAGDPDESSTESILETLVAGGADIIEIGMPFTDPMADGPAIQAAALRALEAGMTLSKTLDIVKSFRAKNQSTPIILMGYLNPIEQFGYEKFCKVAGEFGVDGLILVDLPPEEISDIDSFARANSLDIIRLVTPTTDMKRLQTILDGASGFLYYVSITGVTGTKSADTKRVHPHIAEIKEHTDLPVMVGFGIKTPEDALEMSREADGVVVGSALVDCIFKSEEKQRLDNLKQAVSGLSNALGSAR